MSDPIEDFLEDNEQVKPEKKRSPGCLLNILSGILVAGTMVVTLLFAIIFINPQSNLNPLPPTTLPALVLTNTPTPTPKGILPPTWTPITSPTVTPTSTPIPSNTPEPTPEKSPIPTANVESGTFFTIQSGSPTYETNTFHPNAGCSWLGVAGQVFEKEGIGVSGVFVEAGGTLGSIEISGLALTGNADNYGEGGYELILNDSPVASEGEIWIQVTDHASQPMSEKIYFQTFDSCDLNLVKINFEEVPGAEE